MFLVTLLASFKAGIIIDQNRQEEKILLVEERADKNAMIIKVFNLWMACKQQNRSIINFFERNNIHEIAIYGMHYLGERVMDELRGSEVVVKYVIDKRVNNINADIEAVEPGDSLKEVDAIIVTPVFYFDEIERQLNEKVKCPIISLEDVIKYS